MRLVTKARNWLYWGPRRRLAFQRQLRELLRLQRQPRAAVDAWRAKALAELLAEAARDVPMQRVRFEQAGFDPASVRRVDDLHRLPPVTKAQLRNHAAADLLSRRRAASAMWQHTSGSSGEPFRFAFDPFFHARSNAVRAFIYQTIGVRHGPVVEMYAAPGSTMRPDPGAAGLDRYVLDYALPVAERLNRLLRLRPHVLYGNRSHLVELAEAAEHAGTSLPSLRLIVSSSEVLTPTDATLLQRVFGAPVHDLYGLAEVSTVCFERTPGGGYETVEGRLIVEVLVDGRPAQPGETGELVVTSLDNRVMPFIRYATGDLCTLSEHGERSGRAGMLIARIQGRLVDIIHRADGSPVTYWTLGTALTWSHPEVAGRVLRWQVEQTARGRIVVRVVPTPLGVDEAARGRIVAAVLAAVGPDCAVELAVVGDIPLEANGKFKAVKVSGR